MSAAPEASAPRTPSFWISIVPVLVLVTLLAVNVRVFGSGDNQVALVAAAAIAATLARFALKTSWAELERGILHAIGQAMQAILILLVVGMLIGAWMKSGVVPLLIVYGLKLISPTVFLLTSCVVCCVVSTATGSSWTTAGTVGVAVMGVGNTLGFDPGMVAGAVVSGSYFGDKMSPLSDTTNLAPAMAGATLIEHVKHMVWTVAPSILIALGAYAVMGGKHDAGPEALARVDATVRLLEANFALSPLLLTPPILVLGLIAVRFPALPALVIGTFSAVVIGLILPEPGGGVPVAEELGAYFKTLFSGNVLSLTAGAPAGSDPTVAAEALQSVKDLLDGKGGMKGMLPTVALVFCAMSFGGVMERSGMLGAIGDAVLRLVRGTGSLIGATVLTCFGINVLAADQYMAIVVPGRMYRTAFLKRRLHPKNLSRALEDSGTVTSALVPWNTCGAQMAVVLGVSASAYAPYAILNWLCPLVSIFYGFTGISMTKISDAEAEARLKE
jgi:NhaC family Na+:H+ antiporter